MRPFLVLSLLLAPVRAQDDVAALKARVADLETRLRAAEEANRRLSSAMQKVIVELQAAHRKYAIKKKREDDKQRPLRETRRLIEKDLPNLITEWRIGFNRFPPMTLVELQRSFGKWRGLAMDNDLNVCSEALLVALQHPNYKMRAHLVALPVKRPFGNCDKDRFNRVPAGASLTHAAEILDGWGHPVVYIHRGHYDEAVSIVNARGVTVEVRALRRRNGTFHNPTGFQLISLGPDGKQSADDIVNFTRGK